MHVLAVGDDPPYRETYRDGVRVQLPPPPGSVPPRDMTLASSVPAGGNDGQAADESAAETGEPQPLGDLRPRLGYLSPPFEVGPGPRRITFRPAEGAAWLAVEAPERGDFFVIAWRRSGAESWENPRHLVVPAPPEPGRITFLNVAPVDTAVNFGDQKFGLKPGKLVVHTLPPGDPVALAVAVRDAEGRTLRVHQSAVEHGRAETTWVVVRRADGREPRRPVKVEKLRVRIR
jgi:hypothetical protein